MTHTADALMAIFGYKRKATIRGDVIEPVLKSSARFAERRTEAMKCRFSAKPETAKQNRPVCIHRIEQCIQTFSTFNAYK